MSKTLTEPSGELTDSDLALRVERLERALKAGLWKPGDIKPTFSPVAGLSGEQEIEDNWLLMNGATSISVSKWPELFAKWGYRFGGSGDVFGIPNAVGRTLFGKSAGGTLGTPGATGGVETVTLSISQIPAHDHGVSISNSGGHTHTHTAAGGGGQWDSIGGGGHPDTATFNTGGTGNHSHAATSGQQGGGGSHENLPPFLVVEGWLVYAGLKQA